MARNKDLRFAERHYYTLTDGMLFRSIDDAEKIEATVRREAEALGVDWEAVIKHVREKEARYKAIQDEIAARENVTFEEKVKREEAKRVEDRAYEIAFGWAGALGGLFALVGMLGGVAGVLIGGIVGLVVGFIIGHIYAFIEQSIEKIGDLFRSIWRATF
jgi:hypothetical protein